MTILNYWVEVKRKQNEQENNIAIVLTGVALATGHQFGISVFYRPKQQDLAAAII